MDNNFSELGVKENIVKALGEMDYKTPTEVQAQVIPNILGNKDLIVKSKTGSGKTGAFGISILEKVKEGDKRVQGLILTPTRELAVQVDKEIKKMARYINIDTLAVFGQHSINVEIDRLEKGTSIVTGTPGRVYDHLKKGTLKTNDISFLVIDEADRMLDMGFIDQVVRIIKFLPRERVTLLFSATMPEAIQKICKGYMNNPKIIELESDTATVDTIEQFYYKVEANEKRTQLDKILTTEAPHSCMVFCNTRHEVDRVCKDLYNKGYMVKSIHGANSQSSRMRTIEQFKKGNFQVLVATDVAARGIHIDDLSLVINYDLPVEKDSYVHRIGRTGRAGNGGRAVSLVTKNDLMSLYEIEEHVGALIEEKELPKISEINEAKNNANKWELLKIKNIEKNREKRKNNNYSKSSKNNNYYNKDKYKYNRNTGSNKYKKTDHKMDKSKKYYNNKGKYDNQNKNYKKIDNKYNENKTNNKVKENNDVKIPDSNLKVDKIKDNNSLKRKSIVDRILGFFKKK
jgi:superfamily II DNA/RNA helicase